ncbi:hypothetical protein J2752_002034 [Halarchaeum rubridurum]|uniref:Uncharacterized protein n=1 Tax=Halarchaeum rubridurum TaxID=489911 RepID=A0A830G076_9EURY|nr:hypothetical protein [Halarchaeum rubridurum]MBP1955122.1 hypothetical protein [Halarchaeum rubridurum]GGM68779.1 hypothetical protein GCM10009017_18730 [Halarchaeum rubridurum]
MSGRERGGRGERGQLVLVAAVVIALAFVPALAAVLQFGYAGDADAMAARDGTATATVAALDPAVDTARPGLAANYTWTERTAAVAAYRNALDANVARVENASVGGGRVVLAATNASAATRWAAESCPSGRGRVFGPCEAVDGVVVQERANETHVVAVAFDVTVVGEGSETHLTVAVKRAT